MPSCPAFCSYGSVSSSRTIKNSRLVSQKDDVHVCIMCLRAIMNYQVPVAPVEHWRPRTHSDIDQWGGVCRCVHSCVYWPHPVLSCSFPRSMASTWWCLMHTRSMKSLSVWTIRTQGENWSPPAPQRGRSGADNGGNPAASSLDMALFLYEAQLLSEVRDQRCTCRPCKGMFTKGRLAVNHRGWSLHNEAGRANKAAKGCVALNWF